MSNIVIHSSMLLLMATLLLVLTAPAIALDDKVTVLNAQLFDDIVNDKSKYLLVNIFASWSEKSKAFSPEFAKVPSLVREQPSMSKSMQDKLVVAKLNGAKYENTARRLGVTTFPTVLLFNGNMKHPAHYAAEHHDDEMFTATHVAQFVSELIVGRHIEEEMDAEARRIHMEKNFPHPSLGKVFNLTDDTFNKFVLDPRRTVLVMFYSPWCDHCEEMHPVLTEVAQYFKLDHKVIIGRVDGDENQRLMDKYKVDGFPTIMIFPKGKDKEGMPFAGHRDAEHIQAYVDTMNSGTTDDHIPFTDQFAQHEVNDREDQDPFHHDGLMSEDHHDDHDLHEGDVMDDDGNDDGADM